MSEHTTLGVTSDFDWYELSQVKDQLASLSARVERVIAASQQREKDYSDYVIHLKQQNGKLQAKLNALRPE
jgi:hypothetical protein